MDESSGEDWKRRLAERSELSSNHDHGIVGINVNSIGEFPA